MWTHSILPILLCLQTAAAIPFVTNASIGVSYQGTSANGVEQFQNISYAEDTSGANRFAPPVPFLPARGSTIQATAAGAACPQNASIADLPIETLPESISEDCLTLRIARPANHSTDKPLPVMVWIYGGGFSFGQTYNVIYNPVSLVQDSVASGHPVIYVGINYRVGIFGFAASQALQEAKSENAGLRDQRLALQWVKDNIAAFGGDPDNITAFGQSAGGVSVGMQQLAFGGKQGAAFNKAIQDSGPIATDFSPDIPTNSTAGVAKTLNCSGSSEAMLACLRKVPFEALLDAQTAYTLPLFPPVGIGAFWVVIDGDFIPDAPPKLVLEGSFVKGISLITAWMEDDGSMFTPFSINSEAAVAAFYGSPSQGSPSNSTLNKLLSLYPVGEFEAQVTKNDTQTAQWYRASRIFRDIHIACPQLNFTYEVSRQSTPQTYNFELNMTRLQPVWNEIGLPDFSVAHDSDIPYVFNEVLIGGGDNSKSALMLSAEVSRSFSAFATSGNPTTPAFDWPEAWTGKTDGNATVFVIGGPYGSGPAPLEPSRGDNSSLSRALARERLAERCAFIDSVPAYQSLVFFS